MELRNGYISFEIYTQTTLSIKQGVLSLISSIFDPLGFFAPALIETKWIIQHFGEKRIDWDELLSLEKVGKNG